MLLTSIFMAAALTVSAHAAPPMPKPTQSLKPYTPTIGPGFTPQEVEQLEDAFRDAIMASYAAQPSTSLGTVFNDYFNATDRQVVTDVFKNILGNDPNRLGNPLLANITIVQDYYLDYMGWACRPKGCIMGELRDSETSNPKLVICPSAAYEYGGINRSYPGVPATTCDSLDARASWKMTTLGHMILHEYTHFDKLVMPPLRAEVYDFAYNAFGTRHNRTEGNATENADSYAMFATENYWTNVCGKQYGEPVNGDGFNRKPKTKCDHSGIEGLL